MSKISELSDGGSLQSTDYLIAVRSGGNVKVRPNGAVSGTTGTFSGDLNVDSGTFFVDASANAVGIGNSNPSAFNSLGATDKLVIGDSTVSNLTLFGTNYGSLAFADSDTSGSTAQYAGLIQYYHTDNSMQFYTASTERMRIDSSGNLNVGCTDGNSLYNNSGTNTGAGVLANGQIQQAVYQDVVHYANRTGNDGTITSFQKDGTTVGTIGTNSSGLYIGTTEGSDSYLGFFSNAITPSDSTGAARDDAIDLGNSFRRFKDLYLSGGVYLGGTGAANLLDDYEEGTFTVTTNSDATGVLTTEEGVYTKIGRTVFVEIVFQVGTNFTSNVIGGLPFAVANIVSLSSFGQNAAILTNSTPSEPIFAAANQGGAEVYFVLGSTASNHNPNTTQLIYRVSLTYQTS